MKCTITKCTMHYYVDTHRCAWTDKCTMQYYDVHYKILAIENDMEKFIDLLQGY